MDGLLFVRQGNSIRRRDVRWIEKTQAIGYAILDVAKDIATGLLGQHNRKRPATIAAKLHNKQAAMWTHNADGRDGHVLLVMG